jgi:serine/threonine protein phosphatase PrpC
MILLPSHTMSDLFRSDLFQPRLLGTVPPTDAAFGIRRKKSVRRTGQTTNRRGASLAFKPSTIFRHVGAPAITGIGLMDPSDPNCFAQMDLSSPPHSRAGNSPTDRFESIFMGPGRVATLASIQDGRSHYEDRAGIWRLPSRTGKDWLKRLKAAFARLAEETKHMNAGTTLVTAIISPDKKITLGWIGDSEGHWGFTDRQKGDSLIQKLTPPHSIKRLLDDGETDDLKRILAAGGQFSKDYRMYSVATQVPDPNANATNGLPALKKGYLTVPMTRFFGGNLFPWAIREGEFAQHDYSRLPIRPGPQGVGGYLILNSDGVQNPTPNTDFSEWSYLLKQADQRAQGIGHAKQLGNAPHLANWLVALSEMSHGGDNKTAITLPLPDGDIKPKDRRHYPSILAAIADGHNGDEAAEYVIRRLPQLLRK